MKAVIMAGGSGTRLWPVSRESRPKQFVPLVGERSLLQQTYDRLRGLLPVTSLHVCTVAEYVALVQEQLPELPVQNVIIEPAARSTGPAMGLIALRFQEQFGDTAVATVAADHVIRRPEAFVRALELAFAAVRERPTAVVTVGIRPTHPDTGFGYIRMGELVRTEERGSIYEVEQFVEKPDLERARQFLAEGRYLWNASYFVWNTSQMLALVERHLPKVAAGLERVRGALGTAEEAEVLRSAYGGMPKVAVDTGVMERADNVLVVPAEMGWSDIGSWDRLHDLLKHVPSVAEEGEARFGASGSERQRRGPSPGEAGDVVAVGPHVGLDDRDCLFFAQNRLVATLGLENLVVVETEDAILICRKDRSQDLKKLMDRLREAGKGHYLG